MVDLFLAKIISLSNRYDQHSKQAAINPFATSFHLSGMIERANLRERSGHVPIYGDPAKVRDMTARLCCFLQVPHLSVWEEQHRPKPAQVRMMLEAFART